LNAKEALQEIETAIEGLAGGHDAVTLGTGIGGLTLSGQELGLHANIEVLADYTDPNADRIWFWDDSASSFAGLAVGDGLSLSATTGNVSSGYEVTVGSGSTPSPTISGVTGLGVSVQQGSRTWDKPTALCGLAHFFSSGFGSWLMMSCCSFSSESSRSRS
jgi:hypothetical protein